MEIRKHRWIKYHAPEDKELETVIWCADCGLSQLECADPEKDECRFEMIPILTGVKKRLELLCGGEDPWELGKGVEAMLDAEELRDAELRAANEKIANLTGQVIALRQNLDKAQAEVDRLIGWRGRYEDLMDQLRELESRYNSLFRDLQECRERAGNEERVAIRWRDEAGKHQAEKQNLHQDLEKTKAIIRNLRSENAVLKENIREKNRELVEGEVPQLPEKGFKMCATCEKIWAYYAEGKAGRVRTPRGVAQGKPVLVPSNMPEYARVKMFLGDSVFLPSPTFYLHQACVNKLAKLSGSGPLEGHTVLERHV